MGIPPTQSPTITHPKLKTIQKSISEGLEKIVFFLQKKEEKKIWGSSTLQNFHFSYKHRTHFERPLRVLSHGEAKII